VARHLLEDRPGTVLGELYQGLAGYNPGVGTSLQD